MHASKGLRLKHRSMNTFNEFGLASNFGHLFCVFLLYLTPVVSPAHTVQKSLCKTRKSRTCSLELLWEKVEVLDLRREFTLPHYALFPFFENRVSLLLQRPGWHRNRVPLLQKVKGLELQASTSILYCLSTLDSQASLQSTWVSSPGMNILVKQQINPIQYDL